MALVDRLDTTPRRRTGPPCSVGALESRLEGSEAEALQAMLYTLHWSGTRIHAALSSEGYEVGKQQINRHRASACGCFQR